ncbi:MAG: cellulase family glycosylhydrolase [Bacteroidales bacterium]|nr:cellulase family glycosylhydrolase [Bacteroidales bacterium]
MKKRILLHALLAGLPLLTISCNEKADPKPAPVPAPTAITLSLESLSLPAAAAATRTLTVTAPFRPVVSGVPAWITWKDGVYDNYKISYSFSVSENTTYVERSAEIVLRSGALYKTFTVTQEAAEVPQTNVYPTPGTNRAWEMMKTLGPGWNLGNQLDAYINWESDRRDYPDETCWGNKKATQATFDGVKAAGFKSVRIPVSWLRMIGPAPDYKIDGSWMDRVAEVVGYAHNAGLQVIVNTHHDENHGSDTHWLDIKNAAKDPALNTSIKAAIKAVWTQIATKFKDCGEWLILEGFNELNDGGWGWSPEFRADPTRQCNILNEWNQVFVDAVRATGGNNATRWLGVPTYAANSDFATYLTMPSDPAGKTMISVHFYDPSDYTLGEPQYDEWGHTGTPGKKAPNGDEDRVREVFGKLWKNYVEKDIPVYVGEYGASMRRKSSTRAWAFYKYYMEYVSKAAKTYGLPCFLWDNGAGGEGQEQHGYINHATGVPMGNAQEILDVIVKAWTKESASYTLDTVYALAP